MNTLTFGNYYKRFMNIRGVIAVLVGSFPATSRFLSNDSSRYIFPPLGQTETPARIIIGLLVLAVTYIVFFEKEAPFIGSARSRRRALLLTVVLALLGFCIYLVSNLLWVREVVIPAQHSSVLVSVGFQRTAFAKSTFGSSSDEEMLRNRGTTEEEIRKLWTLGSIVLVRIALFLSYASGLLLLVGTLSLGALYEACGAPVEA